MKAYGFRRTYGGCRTSRQFGKGKIQIRIHVKNHKRGRKLPSLTKLISDEV